MINILSFEFLKFWKRKKNHIVTFCLFSIIIVLFLLQYNLSNEYESSKLDEYEYNASSIQDALDQLPDIESTKEIKKDYTSRLELLEQQIEAHKIGDWRKELQLQITADNQLIEDIENNVVISGESITDIQSRMLLNEEFLNRDIEPVHLIVATEGMYFLNNIYGLLMGLLGFIILIFVMGDILAYEYDRGSIKLMFTQPISRINILHSKSMVAFINHSLLVFLLGLFAFTLGSIFTGIGSIEYPMMVYQNGTLEINSIAEYILKSTLLFTFVCIFAISLIILISILTNSSMVTMGLTIILSAFFYIGVTEYGILSSLAHFIPFTYISTFDISDGSLARALDNNNISYQMGIIVLGITSVFLYILSSILIRNNEIKN